jgi:hypothetical protein
MVIRRRCTFIKSDGTPCQMAPLVDGSYCFAHDPERAADAAEARRAGGLRRRREGSVAIAYDLSGLDTVEGIRRLLVIASTDALSLDNTIAKLRAIVSIATVAMNLLKVGEIETRLAAIEALLVNRRDEPSTLGDIG